MPSFRWDAVHDRLCVGTSGSAALRSPSRSRAWAAARWWRRRSSASGPAMPRRADRPSRPLVAPRTVRTVKTTTTAPTVG